GLGRKQVRSGYGIQVAQFIEQADLILHGESFRGAAMLPEAWQRGYESRRAGWTRTGDVGATPLPGAHAARCNAADCSVDPIETVRANHRQRLALSPRWRGVFLGDKVICIGNHELAFLDGQIP